MARLAVAVCALALLACFAPCSQAVPQIQLDSKAPWFCHGLDCPKFEVVSTSDSYEEREYKAGTCGLRMTS
jgi:hypothetical protein